MDKGLALDYLSSLEQEMFDRADREAEYGLNEEDIDEEDIDEEEEEK
jgi:hypothetical protein